ncbi:MAG: hypothetical protein R3C14_43970 [Caldilineaceae bacterium]
MFETVFGTLLTGTIDTQVEDPAGINPPANIIQTDDPWDVKVDWSISGVAAPFLGGDWKVTVYVESIGPGPEQQVGTTANVPLASVSPAFTRNYTTTVSVGAGTLPAGSYKLVTLLNYSNGGLPQEMAAFDDGTIIQLYDPA